MDMRMGGVSAAIFDLDGTIADSLWVWNLIDEKFFDRRGILLPQDYKDTIKGMGFSQAAAYTKRRFALEQSEQEIVGEWYSMAIEEYSYNIRIKAGVREYLEYLQGVGVKIGLATASGRELFEPLLKNNGIYDFFDAFATTDEAGRDKTFPDVYLLCAKRLFAQPCNCMVFEDILPGVRSSKSAGMQVTGVFDRFSETERQAVEAEADFFIEDFRNAPRFRQLS